MDLCVALLQDERGIDRRRTKRENKSISVKVVELYSIFTTLSMAIQSGSRGDDTVKFMTTWSETALLLSAR